MASVAPVLEPRRKPRSNKPPAVTSAVLAHRTAGRSKSAISRDLGISRPTVTRILEDSDIDKVLADSRLQCLPVIPHAIKSMDAQIEAGDGDLAHRFLKDFGVLDGSHSRSGMTGDVRLQQAINILLPGVAQPIPSPEQQKPLESPVIAQRKVSGAKKSYYKPTGRPPGRPRKVQPTQPVDSTQTS